MASVLRAAAISTCFVSRAAMDGCVFDVWISSKSASENFLLLLAEAVDAQAHRVAGLEELRHGFDAHADAGRCAGADDVTGCKRAHVGQVGNQLSDAEYHGAGIA